LLAVDWSSLVVATLGVILPMILGYMVSGFLLPDAGWLSHLFLGGTLTATSVGITARVLKDLGKPTPRRRASSSARPSPTMSLGWSFWP